MSDEWEHDGDAQLIDAYVDWVRGPGRDFPPKYEEHTVSHCLIRLKRGVDVARFRQLLADEAAGDSGQAAASPRIEVSLLAASRPAAANGEPQFLNARIDEAGFRRLGSSDALRACIDRIVLAQSLPEDAECDQEASEPGGGDTEPQAGSQESAAVVIGIIDEGICFANARFRDAHGKSRVEHVWLQDGRCNAAAKQWGYGRQLTKHDSAPGLADGIDSLLEKHTEHGLVDEDALYREAGLIDFARTGHKAAARRTSHGTHVMDLACGYEPGASPRDGDHDGRPIVCVQLPTATVVDTSGLGLERFMLDGVEFILQKADEIAADRGVKRLPVVINFSSGVLAGPHDGTHPIETAIDQKLRARRTAGVPTEVVLPSGNSYQSRGHAHFSLAGGGERTLHWRVLPDDKTFSFLEIWLPHVDVQPTDDAIELTIAPPGHDPGTAIGNGGRAQTLAWKPGGGSDVPCKAYYEFIEHPGGGGGRGRFTVILLPTELNEPPSRLAPAGVWELTLKNVSGADIDAIHAWIQWDDRPLGYRRRGRQSYFDDPDYRLFHEKSGAVVECDNDDSYAKRRGTVNAIATGHETQVAGGYIGTTLCRAEYAAEGPIVATGGAADPHRDPPECWYVCEDTDILRGVLAAGSRSGSVVAMNGTSVAAPKVTRAIADAFAEKKTDDRHRPIFNTIDHDGRQLWRRTVHAFAPQPAPQPPSPSPERCCWET